MLVLFALVVCLGLPGSAQNRVRSSIGTTLNQCENGTTGVADCTGSAWITGNLNPNNSLYREGDFVPFRSRITNLVAGRTYAFRIGYDAVEKGLHAYDYLGSVDGSESAPGQQVSPCDGVGDTAGAHACGNAPSTLAVPTDTSTTFPPGVGQKDGAFSAWGAALTGAAYVSPAPIVVGSSGTVERSIDVTFTAEGPTVVLAWGGHIASVVDWGAGRTFISAASGSSFHMRLLRVQEGPPSGPVTSTGNQEVSLQATALAPQPSPFTTQIDRTPVEVGSAVVDTATLSGKAGAPVTGVVNFFVCFNSASRPTCTVGRTQVGTGQVLAAPSATSPDGVASVQFVPDTPGSYCFRTEYVPSATALYSPAVHTDTTTECFEAVVTRPLLTLTKICVPATNGRFNLLLDGAAVLSDAACGASAGPVPTTAGSHTVGETAGTATNLTDYTTTIGGDCAPTGSITLTNGQSATCTITNELKGSGVVPGTLTVNKLCPPGADGLFELHVDSLRFPDVACGGGTGPVTLEAGTHTVGEAAGTGTSLADFTTVIGGACAPDGSVTVPPGGAATCTITNTPIPVPPATLTVTKLCVPGSDARFTITVDGKPSGTVGCGGSTHAVEVTAGEHAVGETGAGDTDLSDYTVVQGGDCEADGTIVVDAGEHATCTITNVLKTKPPVVPSTLTVTKVCVPSDDGGLFTLMIDGHGSADQPCGDRLGPIVVSPGAHSVSEAAGARTSLADYDSIIGGDCAADGSVTVAASQSATCTITNVRRQGVVPEGGPAEITIVNDCRPADAAGRFQLNLDETVFPGMTCGDSTGPVVTSAGDHSVGLAAVNARPGQFKTIIGGACSANGKITLTTGQRATCVVTNVRRRARASLRPPPACYRLTVARRMVGVGERVRILARVALRRRPIQGVRVYAVGPGVFEVQATDRRGRSLFVLRLRRAGILRLSIRKPFHCEAQPPRQIGIVGATTPSLTG